MFHSIRWRLVASYTLLTLLTVALVGLLALTLVRNYMMQGERDYLTANAQAVAHQVEPFLMIPGETPALATVDSAALPTLVELAETSAFLGNVRVRILDATGRVLVDSGVPSEPRQIAWIISSLQTVTDGSRADEIPVAIAQPSAPSGFVVTLHRQADLHRLSPHVPLPEENLLRGEVTLERLARAGDANVVIVRTEPSQWGNRFMFGAEGAETPDFVWRALRESESPHRWYSPLRSGDVTVDVPMPESIRAQSPLTQGTMISESLSTPDIDGAPSGAPDGFALSGDQVGEKGVPPDLGTTVARSSQVVTVPIGDEKEPVGHVELSEGPDFGTEALNAIRRAFLIAAGGVSLLSVAVGLLMGQGLTAPLLGLIAATSRMSGGDLSARATVHSRDEAGVLARQFNQMAQQLESSFAALATERDTLRRFITDASHELRTPIMALKTFNELLQGAAAHDGAAQAEFLGESQRQIDRLEWITANLLDLSRLDAGLAELTICEHDVGDLLATVAASFRLLAAQRGLTLAVTEPEPTVICAFDRARLEMALSNLLDNALKYSAEGGTVVIGAARQDHRVRIWVEDTGPGIAQEDLPHIFDRFYHRKQSAADTGSGLGLAIAKAIVTAHGGLIEVESEPGVGTRFTIEFSFC